MEKGGCVVGLEIGIWRVVGLTSGREGVLWEGTIGIASFAAVRCRVMIAVC